MGRYRCGQVRVEMSRHGQVYTCIGEGRYEQASTGEDRWGRLKTQTGQTQEGMNREQPAGMLS